MDSEVYPEIYGAWTKWMKQHLCMSQLYLLTPAHAITAIQHNADPEHALPSIYPDSDGRPLLPDLMTLKLGMDEEKRIMRRYFTSISRK